MLVLSGFPLKIIDISVAYINRLGLYNLEPLVFTGTHLQHVFFQDAHHSNSCSSSIPKNSTGPLDFLFLNVMTFNYNKMSFYCFSADDISASPWASNAPGAVQKILVHNSFRNRFSWWWRCIMRASQNVLVSESTLRYFVHDSSMFVSLLTMLNDVSSILPYTEKYSSNHKTDNLHRLLVIE